MTVIALARYDTRLDDLCDKYLSRQPRLGAEIVKVFRQIRLTQKSAGIFLHILCQMFPDVNKMHIGEQRFQLFKKALENDMFFTDVCKTVRYKYQKKFLNQCSFLARHLCEDDFEDESIITKDQCMELTNLFTILYAVFTGVYDAKLI